MFSVRERITSRVLSPKTYKHALEFGYDTKGEGFKAWMMRQIDDNSMNRGERLELKEFMSKNAKFKRFFDYLGTKGAKGEEILTNLKGLSAKQQQAFLDHVEKIGNDPKLVYKSIKERGGVENLAEQKIRFQVSLYCT